MRRLRSLGAIAFAFALLLAVATTLTGVTVYWALLRTIDHEVDLRLKEEANELLFGGPGDAELARRIGEEVRERDSADIGFLLRDARGARLAANLTTAPALPEGPSPIGPDAKIAGLTRGRALVTTLPSGATLTLVAESEPINRHDRSRVRILIAGFGGVVAMLLLGIFAMARAVHGEIATVRKAAEAIIEGDWRARVPVDRPRSAFGQLAQTFNRMLDRIGELMAGMRSISSDIAHDLRTPLARLHGRLAALAETDAAEPLRPELRAAVAESEEILAIFAAMLRIAEVEAGAQRAGFVTLDLATLAADVAEGLVVAVEAGGRRLIGPDSALPVTIEGDARLLTQAIVNLVENAMRYTPEGTRVRLHVAIEGRDAVLSVEDDGPGIPPSERARALRRFGRLETSRHSPGHGLGLPLVAAIARLHNGALELSDAAPGLRVTMRMPIAGIGN